MLWIRDHSVLQCCIDFNEMDGCLKCLVDCVDNTNFVE